MQVAKLRVRPDENGLVPAGQYFKRLAAALAEANAKRDAEEHAAEMAARAAAEKLAARSRRAQRRPMTSAHSFKVSAQQTQHTQQH